MSDCDKNFLWRSGAWSGTFISGTGQIGQGSGEKRAGNLNFIDGDTAELAVFLPCDGCYEDVRMILMMLLLVVMNVYHI